MTIYPFRGFWVLLFAAAACSHGPSQPQGVSSPVDQPGRPKITGFRLKTYEGPYLAYFLTGKEAEIDEKERRAYLKAPLLLIHEHSSQTVKNTLKNVRLPLVQGPVKIKAVADKGQMDFETKNVILEGRVVYEVKAKNYRLETPKLYYWLSRRETEVPQGTGYKLTTPTGVMEGSGLISKEELD